MDFVRFKIKIVYLVYVQLKFVGFVIQLESLEIIQSSCSFCLFSLFQGKSLNPVDFFPMITMLELEKGNFFFLRNEVMG